MKKTKAAPAPAINGQGKEVLVNVVLDRSGSMQSCREGTISGYNEYLNGLKADKETKYSVSLIQFDSPNEGPELTVSYADKPLTDVTALGEKDYEPRGMTPLYDAVGECIRRVDARGRAVITVIITDGMENASKEFDGASVKGLIAAKEKEGWGFVFLGANIDSAAVGASIGVAATNSINYSTANTRALYANLAYSTTTRSANIRSFGPMAAAAMPFMTTAQRGAVMQPPMPPTTGGRPAAPPPFRTSTPKRRDWAVKQ